MSATITNITWGMAVERVRRRLFNGWQNIAENTTNKEIQLYLYEAIASAIVQLTDRNLAVEGVRMVNEGFVTTYKFSSFTKDATTGYFYVTLPQPPVGLPLGYSIVSPYFALNGAVSYPLITVHPFQRGYYDKIASPNYGVYYFVENTVMYIDFRGNDSTAVGTLYVPMQSSRASTGNDTDIINLPDNAMSGVFDMVIQKLTQRIQMPTDEVNDGVYAPTQKERI